MAYSFDNRVKFVVRYMYDIDNNGILEKNDFDCMALKTTVLELKGGYDSMIFETNKRIMNDLWTEFAEFADFDKDGKVTLEEFKQAILKSCRGRNLSDFPRAFKVSIANAFKNIDLNVPWLINPFFNKLCCPVDLLDGCVTIDEFKQGVIHTCIGRRFEEFPQPLKHFIKNQFVLIDTNGDGLIGIDEYRMDCITRFAFSDIQGIDDSYNKLLTDADRRAGGINLSRYQELYAEFIANPDENTNAVYLFGPLQIL